MYRRKGDKNNGNEMVVGTFRLVVINTQNFEETKGPKILGQVVVQGTNQVRTTGCRYNLIQSRSVYV